MRSIEVALEAVKQQYETGLTAAFTQARTALTAELNQFLRRLRQYESEREFTRAVVDGVSLFAGGAAFFSIEGKEVALRAEKGLGLREGLRFPIDSGHAFRQAVASSELVVTLRTASEVGADLVGAERDERSMLVPVQNGERVAAVLFASGQVDAEGLELVAGAASLMLSRQQKQTGLTELKPSVSTPKAKFPAWATLTEQQRNLHWRARRFARVKVAEWLLNKPEACRAALEQNDLYLFLKKEIDAAREAFRDLFMGDRSMVDYLHLEVVSAAAEGDESKLGAEYPEPLG
jgi:hypothetical protein